MTIKALYYPGIFFAVFIAPTQYAFIRKEYLPDFISPPIFLYGIVLFFILMKIFNKEAILSFPLELIIPYLGYLAILSVSLTYTPALEYGSHKFYQFITFTTLAYFGPWFLFQVKRQIEHFLFTIMGMGITLVILLFIFQPYSYSYHFHTPIGSSYLLIGYMSGLAGLFILYYLLLKEEMRWRFLLFLSLVVLIVAGMIYAGGKGPILFFFLTIFFTGLYFVKLKKCNRILFNKRMVSYPFIISIVSGLIFMWLIVMQEFAALLWRIRFILTSGHYSQVERIENAKVALTLWSENPLGGVGLGGFSLYSFEMKGIERFQYPHNILLEIISETGIIGFLFFSLMLMTAIRNFHYIKREGRDPYLTITFMSFFVFTFFISLVSQDLTNPALFAMIGFSHVLKSRLDRRCQFRQ